MISSRRRVFFSSLPPLLFSSFPAIDPFFFLTTHLFTFCFPPLPMPYPLFHLSINTCRPQIVDNSVTALIDDIERTFGLWITC